MSTETIDTDHNYCTFFPDRWKWVVEYDIAFLCALHDELYEEPGEMTRAEIDKFFFVALVLHYPQYVKLWRQVYKAVRRFGWFFWYLHRMKAWGSDEED